MLKAGELGDCDVDESISAATKLVASLALEHNVKIEVERTPGGKVRVHPGRALQLCLHTLELAIRAVGEDGTVTVKRGNDAYAEILEIHAPPGGTKDKGGRASEEEKRLLAACETLARDIGGSLQQLSDLVSAHWRIRLPKGM
jgi:hypothetical protein